MATERTERPEWQTVTPMPDHPEEPSINGPFHSLADAVADADHLRSFPAGYEPRIQKRTVIECPWEDVRPDREEHTNASH